MGKEGLEEIEKEVQEAKLDLETDDTINILELDKVEWLIKYAKEQAERVQELKNIIEQYQKEEVFETIRNQNKRYRALLERVCQVDDLEDVWDIEDDYRALESESE